MTTAATNLESIRVTKHTEYNTADLWNKDREHFLHPWTHFDSFREHGSLIFTHGKGVHVFDSNGRQYLDGIGGLWCVNVGYGREELVEAMADQARRLPYFNPFTDTGNAPAAELAARLAKLAPGDLNHVFFTSGGSTANDSAIRLVQFYFGRRGLPEKQHIISRHDGYHGSTYLTASMSGKQSDRSPYFSYIDDFIHQVSSPNIYRQGRGLDESTFCDQLVDELEAKILAIGADKVACFIAEPILGAGGVIVPPADYHQRTLELCHKHDILYIADEVVTAFGRLGAMFASKERFGIEPDIIVCAKGITSGYQQLGAFIFSDRINDVISAPDADCVFTNGYTYSGHPVACAVALRNIDIIEQDKLLAHVQDVGPYFKQCLESLRGEPLVGDVRGDHLMMCVENVKDTNTGELFPDALDVGKRIADHCESLGLLIRPIGHLNVLSPCLTISRGQIDELTQILRTAIQRTAKELQEDDHL